MTRRLVLAVACGSLLAGCLPKHPPKRAPRADIAAISDLHLGDPRSILDTEEGRAVLVDHVADACKQRGVKTLVLNGDVLELAMASEESAYGAARALFADLNRVRGLERVVVIVGNHDHKVFEDIPDPLPEKLGREYESGTRFHREVSEVADRLRVTVVYPGWSVLVDGGTVHFTHGHYFDSVVTPSFDGATTAAEVEERNEDWWRFLNAGGRSTAVRNVWRAAYHWGHHVAGIMDAVKGADPHAEPGPFSREQKERIASYLLQHVGDPSVIALVAGHTHSGGGRVETLVLDGREVGVLDPGAWVVGHHGRKTRPHVFFLDTRTGQMRLESLKVPEDVLDLTHGRAFETIP